MQNNIQIHSKISNTLFCSNYHNTKINPHQDNIHYNTKGFNFTKTIQVLKPNDRFFIYNQIFYFIKPKINIKVLKTSYNKKHMISPETYSFYNKDSVSSQTNKTINWL